MHSDLHPTHLCNSGRRGIPILFLKGHLTDFTSDDTTQPEKWLMWFCFVCEVGDHSVAPGSRNISPIKFPHRQCYETHHWITSTVWNFLKNIWFFVKKANKVQRKKITTPPKVHFDKKYPITELKILSRGHNVNLWSSHYLVKFNERSHWVALWVI